MSRGIGKAGLIAAAAASAAAFALADGYAATLLGMPGPAVGNLVAAISRTVPHMLSNGVLSAEPACLATGLVAACAVWTAWAYGLAHGAGERQGEEHGSARWGSLKEGRKFMDLSRPSDNLIFTEHLGLAMSMYSVTSKSTKTAA